MITQAGVRGRPGMNEREREARAGQAREVLAQHANDGVRIVALSWVDNAGITRVKTVPLAKLERAAAWGVGMSPVHDVFALDDSITSSRHIGGPTGDLRLHPDLSMLRPLAAQPGWAWAPVDRYTQDGEIHPACQRAFARRMTLAAREHGVELRMAFEVEWFVGGESSDDTVVPGCTGPAFGMTRVIELSDYIRDVVAALDAEAVEVEQCHPEYAPGQLEISIAADDPVRAADLTVLVRHTIRAVTKRHGMRASFAPVIVAGQVGNGAHVHLSLWRKGRNLFAGGDGRYGLTADGESFLAGILEALPSLCAVGAPCVASYLRLVPSRWAGCFRCWGRENREAALRLVTGPAGGEPAAANAEVKCVDGSANPYLLVGSLMAHGLATLNKGRALPGEVVEDPASLDAAELKRRGVARLPQSLPEALGHLQRDPVLADAMGPPLHESLLAVRRAEIELLAGRTPDEIVAATRWRH
jgi:glutamine synthetase